MSVKSRTLVCSPTRMALAAVRVSALILTIITGILTTRTPQAAMAHTIASIAFISLAVQHIYVIVRTIKDSPEPSHLNWLQNADNHTWPLYAIGFVLMCITGLMLMTGYRPILAFHCGTGLVFLLIAFIHIILKVVK